MEEEEQKIYYLDLVLKNDSFKSTIKQDSTVNRVLSMTNFALLSGLQIHLLPKEQIDDISFEKVIFLFESQSLKSSNLSHLIINQEQGNHLSPNVIKKLLYPFSRNLKKLELYMQDHSGYSIDEWLLVIGNAILQTQNLEKAFIEVKKLFTIFFANGFMKIRIKAGVTKDENFLQQIAQICEKLQFKYFNLKIEDDNVIKKGLDLLINSFTQQKELQSVSLTIGQSCQLSSSACFFESMKNHNLQSLKIKIGNSNTLESQVLQTIFEMIEKGLKQLTLDIGSSTKLFNQTKQIQNPLKLNNLEKLVFKIGKNNGFQNGGANILAHLLDTQKLLIVKICLGDSFQMTDLQSLQMFLLLQKLRTVTQLELQFERDICVNKYCLEQLEKLIQKSTNLMSLSMNFSKQQQELNLTSLLNTLGARQTLVNIDLGIGGQQSLPNLYQFGQQIKKLEYLSAFKIHLKGNNSLDYRDFRNFLSQVKENPRINLLSIKIGQQFAREKQELEYKENCEIVKNVCIGGNPIIVHFSHLNDQIGYQYNFDRLFLVGPSYCISTSLLMPIPANQLIIKTTDKIRDYAIEQVLSLIKNQEVIQIQTGLLDFNANQNGTELRIKSPIMLACFLKYTQRNVTNLFYQDNFCWVTNFDLIFQLICRQIQYDNEAIDFKFQNLLIRLKNKQFDIIRILSDEQMQTEQQDQENQFQNLCKLIEAVSKFEITTLNIDFPIFTFSQNWELMGKAISKLSQLQSLKLSLKNSGLNTGHCRDYMNFQKSLLQIFISNIYLTRYDYFLEQDVFPQTLQYHLGNGIKSAEQELQLKESQRLRIVNGQQNQEDLNVNLQQLTEEIKQLEVEIALRNDSVEQGKNYERQKRKVLLAKQRKILSYQIAQKKFSNRNFKLQSIIGIAEMF